MFRCFHLFIRVGRIRMNFLFFFNDTATTEIYTLSLHDALPIYTSRIIAFNFFCLTLSATAFQMSCMLEAFWTSSEPVSDRKSTRLNSSHANISYAVFCLKKKKIYLLLLPTSHNLHYITYFISPS